MQLCPPVSPIYGVTYCKYSARVGELSNVQPGRKLTVKNPVLIIFFFFYLFFQYYCECNVAKCHKRRLKSRQAITTQSRASVRHAARESHTNVITLASFLIKNTKRKTNDGKRGEERKTATTGWLTSWFLRERGEVVCPRPNVKPN